ncbi:MAG: glycosyltransferase family 2 protein [Chitinophagaceae bacterium]|nr:MAG: glycosyltransferase family 2 protein [Chitinophagaceae bacterium]
MKQIPSNTAIAVFCYKRAAKLRQSMEALLKNPECAQMEILFFSDGPKGPGDKDGVQATRDYIDTLTGFRKIHKVYREKNLSTGPNFQQAIQYLCGHYDQFIVVEDDLIVSPNYLRYMLDALDFYRNAGDVFCVTGFCFPINKGDYRFDTTVHTRFCSYGWGSWSSRVSDVVWDKDGLQELVDHSPGFRAQLNREGLDLYRMVLKQIDGTISTWDIQMQVHVARHSLKVIYPVLSKTHNIGFDSESTNTFGVDYLKTVTDPGLQREFLFCEPGSITSFLQKQLRRPYSLVSLASRKVANTLIKWTNQVKKPSIQIPQA